jgi:aldehyde:ferredoxin oxidoreductase
MLEVYYAARGWDPETGFPKLEKLNELGLDWVNEM